MRLRAALPALVLVACTAAPVPPTASAPRNETIYLIVGGWHTEVALPRAAAAAELPQPLAAAFPGARYLVFGWGERDYYMAPNPGLAAVLRAILPGPAVTLVIPLIEPPQDAFGPGNVLALPVSAAGLARVASYLSGSIAKASDGSPERVAAGREPGSIFYAATGHYDLAYTCNTWSAEALAAAGVPIDPAGVVFASQVVRLARPYAKS